MTDTRSPARIESQRNRELSRRGFLKLSAGSWAALSVSTLTFGCGGGGGGDDPPVMQYPIDPDVRTTVDRMLAFPATVTPGLPTTQLDQVEQYDTLGYGTWSYGSGLPSIPRTDLMPEGFANALPTRRARFASFFTITDIHITDKEAPNQLIYLQQIEPSALNNTSIYSPVMMCTTHVLDAAVQTVNALHKRNPFDFGMSLGDTCNNTSYNELRWYIDVLDGGTITPSSGAHAGAYTIDYQKPYRAPGLDKSIPWYQALGNHDHFYIGSFPVDADSSIGLRASYIADTVWSIGDVLVPDMATFPVLFDMENLKNRPKYYAGVFDGRTPYGTVLHTGMTTEPAFANGAPKVAADPDRRSLRRDEWVQEFFKTTTNPVGHGFNLIDRSDPLTASPGFACYSFVPNPKFPLKVIVLDNTQSETDGSHDIHGHGYLDANRLAWLRNELRKGHDNDQLMIIACHVPIGVSAIGSETEWWAQTDGIAPQNRNAVTLTELAQTLWGAPNLLMWIAGHRHLNVVKVFKPLDPLAPAEQGFWQVETCSLRDFPQQFRTFEVFLNSDYTISIVTTNVDPSVAAGSPAATSRKYAIAVQQIVQNNVQINNQNKAHIKPGVALPTMDPCRVQTDDPTVLDPSIQFVDMTKPQFPKPVQVNGSYNGELYKKLSPRMTAVLRAMFP